MGVIQIRLILTCEQQACGRGEQAAGQVGLSLYLPLFAIYAPQLAPCKQLLSLSNCGSPMSEKIATLLQQFTSIP